MYAFTTTGTTDFLQKLTDKHHEYEFTFMKNRQTTAVYYESEHKKRIFAAGSQFTIIKQYLPIPTNGFVVMQTIPVARESRKIFIEKMERTFDTFTLAKGLNAARVLLAKRKNSFQIFMVWENEAMYDDWTDNAVKGTDFSALVRKPTYFTERAFTQTYRIIEDEQQKS